MQEPCKAEIPSPEDIESKSSLMQATVAQSFEVSKGS